MHMEIHSDHLQAVNPLHDQPEQAHHVHTESPLHSRLSLTIPAPSPPSLSITTTMDNTTLHGINTTNIINNTTIMENTGTLLDITTLSIMQNTCTLHDINTTTSSITSPCIDTTDVFLNTTTTDTGGNACIKTASGIYDSNSLKTSGFQAPSVIINTTTGGIYDNSSPKSSGLQAPSTNPVNSTT
eukprot:c2178_g1_i1 orf=66-620(+)